MLCSLGGTPTPGVRVYRVTVMNPNPRLPCPYLSDDTSQWTGFQGELTQGNRPPPPFPHLHSASESNGMPLACWVLLPTSDPLRTKMVQLVCWLLSPPQLPFPHRSLSTERLSCHGRLPVSPARAASQAPGSPGRCRSCLHRRLSC